MLLQGAGSGIFTVTAREGTLINFVAGVFLCGVPITLGDGIKTLVTYGTRGGVAFLFEGGSQRTLFTGGCFWC